MPETSKPVYYSNWKCLDIGSGVILASILITSNDIGQDDLPPAVTENIASLKRHHPNLPYHFFSAPSIRELIRKNFDTEVLRAFDTLKPFAYKSDLARYCILYCHGGLYADISIYFCGSWSPQFLATSVPQFSAQNLPRMGLFRDFLSASIWDTQNGLFSSPPRHRALELAIRMICKNIRADYYGKNSLCPTGPTLFGKAIAECCDAEELIVGDSRWVQPDEKLNGIISEKSHGFVFGNRLIAVNRKRGGRPLSAIGIHGGNNYNEMWMSRDIYDHKKSVGGTGAREGFE